MPVNSRGATPITVSSFARALEAVRDEAKADRIVLVGHSLGAPVIRQYARLYPKDVAAPVAVDSPLDMRFLDAQPGLMPPLMTGHRVSRREKA
jgi:pimeloyl-ACP methyl ester carboxylesterase